MIGTAVAKVKGVAEATAEKIKTGADRAIDSPNVDLAVSTVQLSAATVGGVCIKELADKPMTPTNEAELVVFAFSSAVLAGSGLANWLRYRNS